MTQARRLPLNCVVSVGFATLMALVLGCGGEKLSAPDTTPPATVSDLRIQATGCDNLTLAWTAPGDDGSHGRASSYDLRCSSAAITEATWVAATQCQGEPAPKASGGNENLTIPNLTAGLTYYFAVKARDHDGNEGGLSNVCSSTVASSTIAWVNDGLARDVDWTNSPTWLRANWADCACSGGYEYAIGTAQGGTDIAGWTFAGREVAMIRPGLTLAEGYTYYFSVRGVVGTGQGDATSSDGITVDITPPRSSVDTLAALQAGASFDISWGGSDDAAGLNSYDIEFRDGYGSWHRWLIATRLTSAVFTGRNLHTYWFRSRAWDNAGNAEAYASIPDAKTSIRCPYVYLLDWGAEGGASGEFNGPCGIEADSVGNVYVAETNNDRVQKFNGLGSFILAWGTTGAGEGQFDSPGDVAIDDSGYVYVADTGNNRVQKFDSEGAFVTTWGCEGTGDGQFIRPRGIAADHYGYVYVTDAGNNRVEKFKSDGVFVATWGTTGTGHGEFQEPCGIAARVWGTIYVVDAGNSRVQSFMPDGSPIRAWGSFGSGNGQFKYPQGVVVDRTDYVYVADHGGDVVQMFSYDGEFITKWGGTGAASGQFDGPAGIAVDASRHVFVTDSRNCRVQKFEPSCP